MKLILTFAFLCIFSVYCFGQNLNYRYLVGNQLEIYAWFSGIQPNVIQTTGQLTIIPLNSPSASITTGFNSCSFNDCKLTLPNGFDLSKEYLIIIDYQDQNNKKQRAWGSLKTTAEITVSKDVDELRNEVLVKTKIPVNVPQLAAVNLQRTELNISKDSFLVTKDTKTVDVKAISSNNPNGANNTELTLKLKKKLDEGATTSFSLPLTTYNNLAGGSIIAEGAAEITGLASPPESPSVQISLANVAAVRQKPVFDLTGSVSFRKNKFATLVGKYSEASDYSTCNNLQGTQRDKCREKIAPTDFFAGFKPTVNFDVGFNSTKSKNTIIINLPFVHYFNLTNKSIIDTQIDQAVATYNLANATKPKATPLYVYGGWAKTPFFRLADIKLSFGPKIELFNRYHPRNLLGSIRADFEFHRWLGTISSRRKLLSQDLNTAASRDADKKLFGKLRGLNFGWKSVPYLAFDGGAKVADETVEKTLNKVKQTVIIPKYNIARVSFGNVGTFEWLVHRRYIGFSMDYSIAYLGTTETNSYATDKLLLLRKIKGFQPFFKTTFEFSLDPARRYSLKTSWENGRTLPTLEYLNKVSTGINITY